MYNVNVHENKRKTRGTIMLDIRTQHIVNDEGKVTAGVLDVAEWERVVAALKHLYEPSTHDAAERVPPKCRSLRELRGLGKEHWQAINSTAYLQQERDAWDR